jgi:hypothetical protein
MDNPQANSAAAWIAGLWLADGYFGLSVADVKGGYRRYYPRNVLVMKDKPVIEAAYQVLRQNGVGAHIAKRRIDSKWQEVYNLSCHGWKRTSALIEFVLPFLVGRKRVSALILRSIVNFHGGGAKSHFTDEERELREWAVKAMKWLNRRGAGASQTKLPAPPDGLVDEDIVEALREIQG